MARGTYRTTQTLQVLRALVEFAESGGKEKPLALMKAGQGLVRSGVWQEFRTLREQERQALATALRDLLRGLKGDRAVDMEAVTIRGLEMTALLVPDPRKPRRQVIRYAVDGPLRDVMLYQVVSLIDAIGGVDRLCFCPAPDCGRAFIKIGRREYCSTRCQQRVFTSTYNPFRAQARRKEKRSGKTTRTR